ncbi:hypothetical protein COCON_G00228730 [Conger conger]|uniref:Uncharacterized protein n=1 Tax=Conger conger TaxID=82655 RepID=A0A9Q1CVE5_CONCO|nr:hypothetical protein COCON_G00228730 [Conger conger]
MRPVSTLSPHPHSPPPEPLCDAEEEGPETEADTPSRPRPLPAPRARTRGPAWPLRQPRPAGPPPPPALRDLPRPARPPPPPAGPPPPPPCGTSPPPALRDLPPAPALEQGSPSEDGLPPGGEGGSGGAHTPTQKKKVSLLEYRKRQREARGSDCSSPVTAPPLARLGSAAEDGPAAMETTPEPEGTPGEMEGERRRDQQLPDPHKHTALFSCARPRVGRGQRPLCVTLRPAGQRGPTGPQ